MKFIIMALALMAMFSTASEQYTQYRLNVNKGGSTHCWCLEEFEFYDQNDAKLTPNPSYGSAQTHNSVNHLAKFAFDEISDNDDKEYCSARNTPTGWLAYDFKTPTKIIAYDLERLNGKHDAIHAPVSWTFEGSHDGVTWVTLDIQNDVQWTAREQINNKKFYLQGAQYTQYQLNVNKNGGHTAIWCLKEFEFYDQNDAKLTPNPSYGSAQTILNENYQASIAFNEISDNNDGVYCSKNMGTGWLAYDFKTPTKIIAYDLERQSGGKNDVTINRAPISWTFEGSHDGVTWVTLDTQNDVQWTAGVTIDSKKFYLQGVQQKALFVGMGECPYNKQTGRVTTVTGTDPIEGCRSSCFNNFQETYFSLYQDDDEMKCSCFEDCDQLAGLETAKTYEILSNHATALLLENDQSISRFAEDLYTCDNNLIQKGSELQTSQSSLSTCNTNLAQKTTDHATSQSSLTTTNSNLVTMTAEKDLWKNRFEAADQYEKTDRAGPSAQAKAIQDFPDPEAAVGSGMVEPSIGTCNSVMEKATFLAMGSLLGGVVVFLATKKQKNEESSALLETL